MKFFPVGFIVFTTTLIGARAASDYLDKFQESLKNLSGPIDNYSGHKCGDMTTPLKLGSLFSPAQRCNQEACLGAGGSCKPEARYNNDHKWLRDGSDPWKRLCAPTNMNVAECQWCECPKPSAVE